MKYLIFFIVLVFNVDVFAPLSVATAEYDKDYLEYDEYGLVEVRCMKCNIPIKKRDVVRHTLRDGRTVNVYAIKTLSNFVAVPYELNNGSFTNILMDKGCARKHTDVLAERQGMADQLRKGWVLEAKGTKRSQKEIKDLEKRIEEIEVSGKYRFSRRGRP